MTKNRTDLEDEKEINHHGEVRTVKTSEDTDEIAGMINENKTYGLTESSEGDIVTIKAFNKDLVHRDERTQDAALREYYARLEMTNRRKLRILNACITFSRKIKPVIAIVFVLCYWAAGLFNYNRME